MANHQVEESPVLSIVDKRRNGAGSVSDNTNRLATPANYASISALRTRLTAISATAFSAANLNAMTENDMIYALRLNDDNGSLV